MKITKSQLIEAVKKEVTRLNKIAIIESRLNDLNKELKILNEGSILLKESYDANKIGKEIDDLIDYSSSLRYDLEDKVKELLGDGSVVTSETKIEKNSNDEEARSYGENWDKTLITIKLNGKDLVKVWVNSEGIYDFGKNSIDFEGLPGDKIFSYDGFARFYFDRSLLNQPDSTSPTEAPRQKRPRIHRPSGDSTQVWQSGLSESDASSIEKLTQNPAVQELINDPKFKQAVAYLKTHPDQVEALEDAREELKTITEGNKELVKKVLFDLGLSAALGAWITAGAHSFSYTNLIDLLLAGAAGAVGGAAIGAGVIANKVKKGAERYKSEEEPEEESEGGEKQWPKFENRDI